MIASFEGVRLAERANGAHRGIKLAMLKHVLGVKFLIQEEPGKAFELRGALGIPWQEVKDGAWRC